MSADAPLRLAEGLVVGGGEPLALIAGPCVIEPPEVMDEVAERLLALTAAQRVGLLFKASYEKDNRSRPGAYGGPGIEAGIEALQRLKLRHGLSLLTDVHRPDDVARAAAVVDVLQVPALLCRQTSLLRAVAAGGRPINVKKGQFLSPAAMGDVVAKLRDAGAREIMLTERGSCFGHDRLVSDPCALPALRRHGCPVVIDAGHAANERHEIATIARAGVAAGADALFVECHPDPARARCDGGRMLSLDELAQLLGELAQIARIVRGRPG